MIPTRPRGAIATGYRECARFRAQPRLGRWVLPSEATITMRLKESHRTTIRMWQYAAVHDACGDVLVHVEAGRFLRILLADAMGHGPAAASVAREFASAVGAGLHTPIQSSTFERWNDFVLDRFGGETLVAVTVLEIDRSSRTVRIWNAGNPGALLLRAGAGAVNLLRNYGQVLGAFGMPFYEPPCPIEVRLDDGDMLMVFSDGLTDQPMNEARIGDQGVAEFVSRTAGAGLDPLSAIQDLVTALRQAGGEMDDLSILQVASAQTTRTLPARHAA